MKTRMRHLLEGSLFVGLLGLVVALIFLLTSCTAPVNVNVKAESWQCENKIENQDGSVNFKGCEKTDGQAPVDQDATDGEDKLEVSRFVPSLN